VGGDKGGGGPQGNGLGDGRGRGDEEGGGLEGRWWVAAGGVEGGRNEKVGERRKWGKNDEWGGTVEGEERDGQGGGPRRGCEVGGERVGLRKRG